METIKQIKLLSINWIFHLIECEQSIQLLESGFSVFGFAVVDDSRSNFVKANKRKFFTMKIRFGFLFIFKELH